MSKTRTTRASEALGAVASAGLLALVLAFFPVHADAVTCPVPAGSTDTDADGFTDQQECNGLLLAPGLTLPAGLTSIPVCPPNVAAADRPNCVDPNSKDFFVVIARATPTLIPTNSTQFISDSLSQGGLAITVHEIVEGQVGPDRLVMLGGTQKYLKVTESLAPATADDNSLGVGNVGTVNSAFAFAIVFTQRIVDYHASVYASKNRQAPAAERDNYIRHTVAHEISHNLDLCACPDNPRTGGRHYKTGTVVVMEQSVKVTTSGSTVVFSISTDYPSADQTGAHLH
jgi:hypothetical protein